MSTLDTPTEIIMSYLDTYADDGIFKEMSQECKPYGEMEGLYAFQDKLYDFILNMIECEGMRSSLLQEIIEYFMQKIDSQVLIDEYYDFTKEE